MKKRAKIISLTLALVAALVLVATASGGTAEDPLVSKSFVDKTFFEKVITDARGKIENAVSSFKTEYLNKISSVAKVPSVKEPFAQEVADSVLESLQSEGKYLYSNSSAAPQTLMSGDVVSAKNGTVIIITEGSAICTSGSLVNIVQGRECVSGNALGRFTAFMFPEGGATVEITSKNAKVLLDGTFSISGYEIKHMDKAYALKKLGLVRGAANGMELYRGNTRAESITMLIRLLGEEVPALEKDHQNPFTDVDAWAKRYVGYAYVKGYTKGVSNTRYDGSSLTTAGQYMTFILRALGYSEAAGDFKYETALSDAVRLGVIDSSVMTELSGKQFRRDDVMHLSYLAMSAKVKGSNKTLLSKLVASGAVAQSAANEFLR